MPDQLSTELASLKIARDEGPPPRGVLKVLFALVLIAAAGVAAYLFGLPYLEARVFKLEVSFTEIATVSPAQQAVELTATGYVVADTRSTVAPKVAGKVSRVMVKQGDQVKAGDVLFELDPRDQRAAAAAAATRVSAAQARAERARADLAEAELKAKREQALVARGVAPAEQAENLSARVISLTRAVKAAEAQVRVARAEAHASHVNLRSYQVRAPISGTVLNRPPAAGEVVGFQPGGVDEALGGVKLADFSTLVVEADVSEARLHLVKLGGPAEIVLDAFPQRRLRGKALALLTCQSGQGNRYRARGVHGRTPGRTAGDGGSGQLPFCRTGRRVDETATQDHRARFRRDRTSGSDGGLRGRGRSGPHAVDRGRAGLWQRV